MYVRPARPDLLVRDPTNMMPLPPEGRHVVDSQYWWRLLRDGAVIECDPPAEPPQPAQPEPKPEPEPAPAPIAAQE